MATIAALLAIVVPFLSAAGARAATFTLCDAADGQSMSIAQADALLANKYSFPPFATVTLPSNLTWKENPFHNDSWVLKLHQMYWTEPLWYAYIQTGQTKYRNRYVSLLQSWYSKNPQSNPPSPWSWAYHSVAIRSMVIACALQRGISSSWTRAMADQHGAKLATSTFYLKTGNRALDQDIGLLDIGCARSNGTWRSTAVSRMNNWATHDIDSQGVSAEQSDGYNLYVYRRLDLARRRLIACGLSSPTVASQDQKMVNFIANAETPWGHTTNFGDTSDSRIPYDFTDTSSPFNWMYGNGGPGSTMPSLPLYGMYYAGYAFFRSGWGTAGTVKDQTHIMVRFGAARANHGHMDAGSLTLDAYGNRLLLDSGGPYVYDGSNPYRQYFASERANSGISIDGNPMHGPGWAYLKGESHDTNMDFVSVYHTKFTGVTAWRRVLYDRRLNVMIVDDSLVAGGPSLFRQNWHLRAGAAPAFIGHFKFFTNSPSGPNVAVIQLIGGKTQEVRTGATNPIQGWITGGTTGKYAAPVVSVKTFGRSARYITLIVPSPVGSTRTVNASNFHLTPTGYSVDLTFGGMTHRLSVSQTSASLVVLS